MPSPTIRVAVPDDAEAGAALHQACWLEAYPAICGEEIVRRFASDDLEWGLRWRTSIEHGPPRWLAEHDGELVGFATAGDGDEGFELRGLYVRMAWWGTGLGDQLLSHALGDRPAMLWVLDGNDRARRFYERHGFTLDGQRMFFDPLQSWKVRMSRGARR